jgi:hypothetical protein
MSIVALLATFVAVALSAVLLVAALGKVRSPELTAETLRGLGVSHTLALPVTRLLLLAELGTASAVLFAPASTFTHAAIVMLAVAFAIAGVLALRSDEPLRCSCFGAGGGYLGWRQIAALVPWLAGVAVLRFATPSADGASLFTLTAFLILGARLLSLTKAYVEARGDRKSAQEMLLWLPSH